METKHGPGTYKTIVIDPPWPGPGNVPAFDGHRKVNVLIPYSTMTGIQIASLRVPDLAAKDGQLWIWATTRGLGDAALLMQSWGFKYRAMFIWDKQRLGLGKHVRHQCEFLLWGARRGAKQIAGAAPNQVHKWPVRSHSEKPGEAYGLIKQLSAAPRLDIFARHEHPGFEAWGNEVSHRRGLTA